MADMKKEFQKAVKTIRAEIAPEGCAYPKAMMTGQQVNKGTATVNCGRSQSTAQLVIKHRAFVEYLKQWNATATIETATDAYNCAQTQIRLHFPAPVKY